MTKHSNNCNTGGEALDKASDVERYRNSIPSTAPAEPLRIQLTTEATRAFLSFDTHRSLTAGVIAL